MIFTIFFPESMPWPERYQWLREHGLNTNAFSWVSEPPYTVMTCIAYR
jgi:hypothetical protein